MGNRRRRAKFDKRYVTLDFLECVEQNKDGRGIVMFHDKPFYVDELIKGEKARIYVFYEEASHGDGRAVMLEEPSPSRALPLGHWKFSMGSYQIPHMTDAAQDAFKQERVNKLFSKFGEVKPIIVGQRTNYRNKLSLTDGGFMAPGRGRKFSVKPEQFDLMDFDLTPFKEDKGITIIRKLKTTIIGRPGEKLYAEDEVMGKKFRVGLDAFYQVNTEMMIKSYSEIISWVPEGAVVFDLFGGAATIGIHVADKAKEVYSVEINEASHQDALANIELNGIKNVHAICGDANAFAVDNKIKADVIIVDPARAGLSEDSVKAINNSGAKRVIYLSCNIDTQITDVEGLTNYKAVSIQPYDFFPQTYHIENLIVLDKA